jgi:hypothetical protein
MFQKIAEVAPKFLAAFFHSSGFVLIFTGNVSGHILGIFLTNSSGHPGEVWGRGHLS